jgi:hypothetical protein
MATSARWRRGKVVRRRCRSFRARQVGRAAEVGEQQEALREIFGQDLGDMHAGLAKQRGDLRKGRQSSFSGGASMTMRVSAVRQRDAESNAGSWRRPRPVRGAPLIGELWLEKLSDQSRSRAVRGMPLLLER